VRPKAPALSETPVRRPVSGSARLMTRRLLRFVGLLLGSAGLITSVGSAYGQSQIVIGLVGDFSTCSGTGNNGNDGPRNVDCGAAKSVASVIHGWNPDYIFFLGDNSYNRGTRAETYKAVLVKSLNAISTGSQTVTVDTGQLNGNLNLFGTGPLSGGPYLMPAGTTLAVDEGTANYELITATSVTDSTHFVATFAKTHSAGALIRNCASVPYADDIARQKVWPVWGNHDWDGGNSDYCVVGTLACTVGITASTEYFTYVYTLSGGKNYYTKTFNGLLTGFFIDDFTSEPDGYVSGSTQANKFATDMAACSTPWCVAIQHHVVYASPPGDGWCCNQIPSQYNPWSAGTNVALDLAGSDHGYERSSAPNNAASKYISYVVNGMGGEGLEPAPPRLVWSQQSNYVVHGAVKMTVTATRLTLEAYDSSGNLIDSQVLSKLAGITAGTGTSSSGGTGSSHQ
jgi:hypothetical protein